MNAKQRFLCLSLLAIVASVLFWRADSVFPSGASSSPLPTPPLPSPTPVPMPKCHALAIAHVAREHSIPQDQLLAGRCFLNADKRWVCDDRERCRSRILRDTGGAPRCQEDHARHTITGLGCTSSA
jgi:hypothetical protein